MSKLALVTHDGEVLSDRKTASLQPDAPSTEPVDIDRLTQEATEAARKQSTNNSI